MLVLDASVQFRLKGHVFLVSPFFWLIACKMGLTDLRDSRCVPIVLIKAVIVLL